MAEGGTLTVEQRRKKRALRFVANMTMLVLLLTVVGASMASVGLLNVFILVCVWMLPALVAFIVDSRSGRYASKTVIAFNIAGIAPHLAAVLGSGTPDSTAISVLMDAKAWLIVYGFAAFGWGVIYLMPMITQMYLEMRAGFIIKKMEFFQRKLVEEWGETVKKTPK